MRRRPLLVAVAIAGAASAFAAGCSDDPVDFCGAAGTTIAPLDGPDSVAWWRQLESQTRGEVADDVRALRVVAEQVAALGPDASADEVARRVLRPQVASHVLRVAEHVRTECG